MKLRNWQVWYCPKAAADHTYCTSAWAYHLLNNADTYIINCHRFSTKYKQKKKATSLRIWQTVQ